jgi:hypothetical protein
MYTYIFIDASVRAYLEVFLMCKKRARVAKSEFFTACILKAIRVTKKRTRRGKSRNFRLFLSFVALVYEKDLAAPLITI